MSTVETQMVDARWYVYALRQGADDNLGKILIGRVLYRRDWSPAGMYRAYYIQSEVLGEKPSLFDTLVESERWIQQRWQETLRMREVVG